jgi:2-keto-4-pentenoate hydratase
MSHDQAAQADGKIPAMLVAARLDGRALPGFPGPLPVHLNDSYALQEAALARWPQQPIGWKVGGVPPNLVPLHGTTRVAGPIFADNLWQPKPGDGVTEFPVFDGGFSAAEAEFSFRIKSDCPAGKTVWSEEEAWSIVDAVHISIETAGSPMAMINDLGPTAVASDFGNNFGLILGAPVTDWQDRAFSNERCETWIDGTIESLRFLAGHCAGRNRPLRAGMLVASGAVTGVHLIRAGQNAVVRFGRFGEIKARAVQMRAP